MADTKMLNDLYAKNGLTNDDVFINPRQGWKIITRSGIDKIQAANNIRIEYAPVQVETECVVIKAKATRVLEDGSSIYIETFGEASWANKSSLAQEATIRPVNYVTSGNAAAYPWAMAEKRAMSRAVLKAAGLYQEGFFSEDEADDFRQFVLEKRKEKSTRVKHKV